MNKELLVTLKAIVAALTQPVQFTGIRNGASCDVLRGDCATAVQMAKAAIAKAQMTANAQLEALQTVEQWLGDQCDQGVLDLTPEFRLWQKVREAIAKDGGAA